MAAVSRGLAASNRSASIVLSTLSWSSRVPFLTASCRRASVGIFFRGDGLSSDRNFSGSNPTAASSVGTRELSLKVNGTQPDKLSVRDSGKYREHGTVHVFVQLWRIRNHQVSRHAPAALFTVQGTEVNDAARLRVHYPPFPVGAVVNELRMTPYLLCQSVLGFARHGPKLRRVKNSFPAQ